MSHSRPLSADQIGDIGRQLFGDRWQAPLANALGVDVRLLRYWLSGERHPSPTEEDRLLSLLEYTAAETQRRAGNLSANREPIQSKGEWYFDLRDLEIVDRQTVRHKPTGAQISFYDYVTPPAPLEVPGATIAKMGDFGPYDLGRFHIGAWNFLSLFRYGPRQIPTTSTQAGITKLKAAEQEIIAAVRLFFDGGDSIPVYVLAAAAREITTTLCIVRGVPSFFDDVKEAHPGISAKELYKMASRHSGFFKHADRDPESVLTNYSEEEAEAVMFTAVHDFGRLSGGMPIEGQVFEAWYLALHLPSDVPERLLERLPNLKAAPRVEKIAMGRRLLEWARAQPEFEMTYRT